MGIFNLKEIKEKIIEEKLKRVFDPEIPINIYDLGLIYKVELEEKDNYLFVKIEMTLNKPCLSCSRITTRSSKVIRRSCR